MSKESLCICDVLLCYGVNPGRSLNQRNFLVQVIENFMYWQTCTQEVGTETPWFSEKNSKRNTKILHHQIITFSICIFIRRLQNFSNKLLGETTQCVFFND